MSAPLVTLAGSHDITWSFLYFQVLQRNATVHTRLHTRHKAVRFPPVTWPRRGSGLTLGNQSWGLVYFSHIVFSETHTNLFFVGLSVSLDSSFLVTFRVDNYHQPPAKSSFSQLLHSVTFSMGVVEMFLLGKSSACEKLASDAENHCTHWQLSLKCLLFHKESENYQKFWEQHQATLAQGDKDATWSKLKACTANVLCDWLPITGSFQVSASSFSYCTDMHTN